MDEAESISISFVFGLLAGASVFLAAATLGQVDAEISMIFLLAMFVFTILALSTRR